MLFHIFIFIVGTVVGAMLMAIAHCIIGDYQDGELDEFIQSYQSKIKDE